MMRCTGRGIGENREGEAPAEPQAPDFCGFGGSAGASPSRQHPL
jgi:hypothetical protein